MSSWLVIIAIIFIVYSCSKNKGKGTADRILEEGRRRDEAKRREVEKEIQKWRKEIARLEKTNPSAARREQMRLNDAIREYNQGMREIRAEEEIASLRRELEEIKKWRR